MFRFWPLAMTLAALPAVSSAQCAVEMQGSVMFLKGGVGNPQPLDLVIDSGSIRTSLDEAVASRFGFDLSFKATSSGGNGRQQLSVLKDVEVGLCGKNVIDPIVVVYPLDFLTKATKHRVDGVVGIEFFRKYVVTLDYPKRQFEVADPATFTYNGAGVSVPVSYGERLAYVTGFVTPFGEEPIPVKLMVDSGGSALDVDFYQPFERARGLVAKLRDTRKSRAVMFTGDRESTRGKVERLTIGGLTVDEPEVQVLAASKAPEFSGWDGTLGSGFLRRFKVIFDLPHDRIIFEKPE